MASKLASSGDNIQVLEIGHLPQEKQSARWVKCIGSERERGKLNQHVADIAMNLWEYDFLQQWKTQINISPISEANHKLTYASEKNTKRYYQEQLPTIQVVHKQGTITANLSKEPKSYQLKVSVESSSMRNVKQPYLVTEIEIVWVTIYCGMVLTRETVNTGWSQWLPRPDWNPIKRA